MIPKRAFFFWGSQPMSWLRFMSIWSFKTLNPDWKVQLYVSDSTVDTRYWITPNHQDFHTYKGTDYKSCLENTGVEIIPWEFEKREIGFIGPSHQSNFFKWDQLAGEGGLFSDLDILYIKPIDEWYNRYKDCEIVVPYCGYFLIGFMASSPNNKFFRKVHNAAYGSYNSDYYQSAGVVAFYAALEEFGDENGVIDCSKAKRKLDSLFSYKEYGEFDHQLIYPWTHENLVNYFLDRDLHRSNCIGLHWYGGGSISQAMNNLLTFDNWRTHRCVLTNQIEKLFGELLQ